MIGSVPRVTALGFWFQFRFSECSWLYVPGMKLVDRVKQLAGVPNGPDAYVSQIFGRQLRSCGAVDIVLSKRLGVVLQPKIFQPAFDVHRNSPKSTADRGDTVA